MMRDFVLAVDEEMREASETKDGMESEVWGDKALADAPWETEVVTTTR